MNFNILFFLVPALVFASPGYKEPWGMDASLKMEEKKTTQKESIPIKIANAIINFHQEVISPVDGPRSHFRPTSSQYMKLAMRRYGFIKGYLMGCDRLLRENDEEWVYRKIQTDGRILKYDPALENKYQKPY